MLDVDKLKSSPLPSKAADEVVTHREARPTKKFIVDPYKTYRGEICEINSIDDFIAQGVAHLKASIDIRIVDGDDQLVADGYTARYQRINTFPVSYNNDQSLMEDLLRACSIDPTGMSLGDTIEAIEKDIFHGGRSFDCQFTWEGRHKRKFKEVLTESLKLSNGEFEQLDLTSVDWDVKNPAYKAARLTLKDFGKGEDRKPFIVDPEAGKDAQGRDTVYWAQPKVIRFLGAPEKKRF